MENRSLFVNAKEGIRWGWFDFSNSSYYVVYIVLSFPLFLRETVFVDSESFEAQWGLAQGLAIVVGVAISLMLSRKADVMDSDKYWALSKRVFIAPAIASFAFPALIYLSAGPLMFLFVFVLVHGVYLASLVYYDASLTDVSRGPNRIEISGWAWGWGYIGGVACLVLMKASESFVQPLTASYFAIGSLFFLFTAYLAGRSFRKTYDNTTQQPDLVSRIPQNRVSTIATTNLAGMLLFMVLIMDGVAVFIGFMSLYWKDMGLTTGEILNLMILLQLLSFLFSGLASAIARLGLSLLLVFCGVMWVLAGLTAVLIPTYFGALVAVVLVATVLGASQALLRTIFSEVVMHDRRLFGFSVFALIEKGAAFVGPVLAGLAITTFGFKPVLAVSAALILLGCLGLSRLTQAIGVR